MSCRFCRAARPPARSPAFTLLEVLLVTLVLVVVVSISIPNFGPTFRKMELKQAAGDLAYTMRYAQSRAVTYNAAVRLQFASDLKSYWLTQQDKDSALTPGAEPEQAPGGDEKEEEFTRVSGRYGKTRRLPAAATVDFEAETLTFFPDGSIEKAEISICGRQNCYGITTKERRGYVYVYGYTPEV